MPRTRSDRIAAQNAAFLAALARTGNSRLAARTLGVHRGTYAKRRARDPHFAAQWQAALDQANAILPSLSRGGGPSEGRWRGPGRSEGEAPFRTQGGEPVVVRLRCGRHQLRRARPGQISKAGEQAFLRALSACANIRLAAAAAGFAHSSFYARRARVRAFAREMRLALATGYEQVEIAALRAALPDSGEHDGWRGNEPPPIPRMTPDQALQLLFLHQRSVRQGWDEPHRRRRRNEPVEVYHDRLKAMWLVEQRHRREDEKIAAALANGRSPCPTLANLEQVAGWSKADPDKRPHDPGRALFGGWRLKRGRR